MVSISHRLAEVSIPFFVLSFCFIHTGEADVLGMWREPGGDPGRQKHEKLLGGDWNHGILWLFHSVMAVCQNLVPLVNIKIAGKWMFIPLKMVLIGIDS